MEQNALIKTSPYSLQKLGSALAITEKLLQDYNPLGLPDLIPYRKGDKWGFCNRKKEIVIECVYDKVEKFSEGLARVRKYDESGYIGKNEFINKNGEQITTIIYNEVRDFVEGKAAVNRDWKWGFIDCTGREIIEPIFDKVGDFSQGLAWVILDGACTYIKSDGMKVLPLNHNIDRIASFSENIGRVRIGNTYLFFDINGKELLTLSSYRYISEFSEGLAGVFKDGKMGFINKSGEEVIPCIYDEVTNYIDESIMTFTFSEGLVCLRKDEKWGFIDKNGEAAVPFIYDDANSFSEGLASVKKDGRWGFIDKLGNIKIPFDYSYCRSFSQGRAYYEYRPKLVECGFVNWHNQFDSKRGFLSYTGEEDNLLPTLHYGEGGDYTDFKDGLTFYHVDDYSHGDGLHGCRDSIESYIDKNGTEYYEK